MATLSSILPEPTQQVYDRETDEASRRQQRQTQVAAIGQSTAPPYGSRKGWVPRSQADFGEGGAYPEIQIVQHPLGMGQKKTASNALARTVDAQGNVKYDAIAKYGHSADKVVHSKYSDLLPKNMDDNDPSLSRPNEESIAETTEKTRLALEKKLQAKISTAMPVKAAEKAAPAQYIRYTPAQQGVGYNSGAKQRIIRMVEVQKDPMEPPRFKTNKKIPRGPASPPAPVMHSPNRKVTVKEQQEWKIPPCISNWKNAKGYTIPLDKRLAADGRGLQGVHINENFAKFAESLYIADRKAREAVERRAQIEKQVSQKEKEKKEEKLRELAAKAREARAGQKGSDGFGDKDMGMRERDDIRRDRHRDRQRDRNIARAGQEKRSKLLREKERDISEKVALGQAAKVHRSDDSIFDQRLFNQSKGMDSGFKDDEAYNVYDEPWRKDQGAVGNAIYRPSKNINKDYGADVDDYTNSDRFVPDRGFSGADRSGAGGRDGPVQYEKLEEADDPFGLDKFLSEVKRGGAGTKRSSGQDERRQERKRDRRE